jgi:hypothetical protein
MAGHNVAGPHLNAARAQFVDDLLLAGAERVAGVRLHGVAQPEQARGQDLFLLRRSALP